VGFALVRQEVKGCTAPSNTRISCGAFILFIGSTSRKAIKC
jgi:hypothetical protein